MGWKISAIIINKKYDKEVTRITQDIGLGISVIESETTLGSSLYIGDALKLEQSLDDYDLPFEAPGMLLGQRLDSDEILSTKMYVLKIEK